MGQNAPHYQLEKLPPLREKVETIEIHRPDTQANALSPLEFSLHFLILNPVTYFNNFFILNTF